jgi:polyhydroxyalkanoate synthesis regulator phasin
MTEQQPRDRETDPFREGVRTVTGILGALKEAIEETFDELRERGDISPERAKEAARSTMKRAQGQFDEMRERLDFVTRREFDALRAEVESLRARLDAHEAGGLGTHRADAGAAGGPGFTVDEG